MKIKKMVSFALSILILTASLFVVPAFASTPFSVAFSGAASVEAGSGPITLTLTPSDLPSAGIVAYQGTISFSPAQVSNVSVDFGGTAAGWGVIANTDNPASINFAATATPGGSAVPGTGADIALTITFTVTAPENSTVNVAVSNLIGTTVTTPRQDVPGTGTNRDISVSPSTTGTARTLLSAIANGTSGSMTTTQLTLNFDDSVTETIAPGNVSVSGGGSNVTVVSVTGEPNNTRTVNISGSWADNTIVTVGVSGVSGYNITGTPTATLVRDVPPPPTGVPNITGYITALFAFLMLSAVLWGFLLRRRLRDSK
jgi:hypothetical protein